MIGAFMEKRRVACGFLLGKCEGKGPFERPRRRWEDNIELDLEGTASEGVDWIRRAQNRANGSLVKTW